MLFCGDLKMLFALKVLKRKIGRNQREKLVYLEMLKCCVMGFKSKNNFEIIAFQRHLNRFFKHSNKADFFN